MASATFIDITGHVFGDRTALEYRGASKWLCRCKCGREVVIKGSDLRSLRYPRCLECTRRAAREALIGTKFYAWTIIESRGNGHYLCRCSCGESERAMTLQDLRSGRSKQCGKCAGRDRPKNAPPAGAPRIDLTGKSFGAWTALRPLQGGFWFCACQCGKTGQVRGDRLQSGRALGCRACVMAPKEPETKSKTLPDRFYRVNWDAHP